MMPRLTRVHVPIALVLAIWLTEGSATGQSLGTFRWQLSPFCNTVTLSVTQTGGVFTLDGFDDLCGAAKRASAVGIAFVNPDGSAGLGLTIVQVGGGAPVHLDATLDLATVSGAWRDSAGHAGPFVFSPPVPAPGAPRPTAGGLSAVAVTAVSPGTGLLGGGTTGNIALSVAFGGTGAADTVARSDHMHGLDAFNTSVGAAALVSGGGSNNTAIGAEALRVNTTGSFNTAVGRAALGSNSTGFVNTAVGFGALLSNQDGFGNTAVGVLTLDSNTDGENNVAVGGSALRNNTEGRQNVAVGAFALDSATGNNSSFNVAIGYEALTAATTGAVQHVAVGRGALGALNAPSLSNTAIGDGALGTLASGSSNIGVGAFAGQFLTSGSRNIYIGASTAVAAESDTIRIGRAVFPSTIAAYIGGIHGRSVDSASDQLVLVDASGKLGTVASSARFKRGIAALASDGRLLRLRPVSFRYRPEERRGDTLQYGLIAEEVADVMPELVVRDTQGQPLSVRYHVLAPLLLAEVQRLERERAELTQRMEALARDMAALRDRLKPAIVR